MQKGKNSVNRLSTPFMLEREYYLPVLKMIFRCFVSFEMYLFYWIYRITKFTNLANGYSYRDPTNKTLLCIFVPFYYLYWAQKSARRIDSIAKERGAPSSLARWNLILFLFGGLYYMPFIMQSKVNKIVF